MSLDKDQILNIIPHRPPFLWIDRVIELEAGMRCVATKYISPDEPVFAGHFPGNAVLPGVLIIEAAAQTAAAMLGSVGKTGSPVPERAQTPTCLLASVRSFKFLKPVLPCSELRIETRKEAEVGTTASVRARAWVGDQEVAKGELLLISG